MSKNFTLDNNSPEFLPHFPNEKLDHIIPLGEFCLFAYSLPSISTYLFKQLSILN